jgi:hypothetical protein
MVTMKVSTLPPALQSISEEDAFISKSASPKLTYRQAIDGYFIAGPGEICQVARCSIEQFTAFVAGCVFTAKNPKVCEKALADLDYVELLSRWYALDTLKIYGAIVPLYPSVESAEQGIQQERLS